LLRTKVDPQTTLWETILPPEFLGLPPGLSEVDHLLDDPAFFEPFEEFFDPEIGRPSIPMETYLRMMFLRFRYRLGFETLCAEVTDELPELSAYLSTKYPGLSASAVAELLQHFEELLGRHGLKPKELVPVLEEVSRESASETT